MSVATMHKINSALRGLQQTNLKKVQKNSEEKSLIFLDGGGEGYSYLPGKTADMH